MRDRPDFQWNGKFQKDVNLTEQEKLSLLFYQGGSTKITEMVKDSTLYGFYEIKNIHNLLNAFLFPGIVNEEIRFLDEKKGIELHAFDHIDKLIGVYEDVYSAMCKYTLKNKGTDIYVYRGDRKNSYNYFSVSGEYPSFISTSYNREKAIEFTLEKEGILLEIEAPEDIVYINMNDALGSDSAYPDEEEILFPPFLKLDYEEANSDEALRKSDGTVLPKYRVHLHKDMEMEHSVVTFQELCEKDYVENLRKVFSSLRDRKRPDNVQINKYLQWKKMLQSYLRHSFKEIKRCIFDEDMVYEYQKFLHKIMKNEKEEADKKRKKYERQKDVITTMIIVMQVMTFLLVSIGALYNWGNCGKTLEIVFITLTTILTYISQSMMFQEKLQKWTKKYLRLDELELDLILDWKICEPGLIYYTNRLKRIVYEDNIECEQNIRKAEEYINNFDVTGKYISSLNQKNICGQRNDSNT